MAIYLMEGFDASNVQLFWQTRYPTMVVSGGTVTTTTSLYHSSNAQALWCANASWEMPLNATAAVATLGFFTRGNTGGNFGMTFRFRDAADAELCTFELAQVTDGAKYENAGYVVRMTKGGVTIATNRRVFRAYTEWVYHEIKVTFSATVGTFEGRYTPQHSRTPIAYTWDAATTGLDLGAGPCDNLLVTVNTGNNANNAAIDDMYVADDYLDSAPIHIIGQWPVAAGATQDWTLLGGASLQACLGSSLTKTVDTDRISSDGLNEVALATLTARESLFTSGATILAMKAAFIARMDTAGSLTLGHVWRNGAGQADTSTVVLSSGTWIHHEEILEDDPTTAAPWVFADLDGLQAGIKNLG
jgi:hypothetical protein